MLLRPLRTSGCCATARDRLRAPAVPVHAPAPQVLQTDSLHGVVRRRAFAVCVGEAKRLAVEAGDGSVRYANAHRAIGSGAML